ncbi:MAG: hypothetical protein HY308_01295 [Gammaproteobacteria bacterium]|nr:hypothetical protein [Gammaproteobacteria bacterium]
MNKNKDQDMEIDLPDADDLSQLYEVGADEMPPARLDARIKAEAHAAVDGKPRSLLSHWRAPFATAAVIVLSVTLITFMKNDDVMPPAPSAKIAMREQARLQQATPDSSTVAPSESQHEEERAADAPIPEQSLELAKKSTDTSQNAAAPATRRAETAPPETATEPAAAPAPSAPTAAKPEGTVAGAPATDNNAYRSLTTAAKPLHGRADIVSVEADGTAGAYQFTVTIKSADTGCQQYADWWEVVSEDGRLLYRKIMLRSHVNDQPFARAGGPVPIQPDTVVWIRAHMRPTGYGGVAFKGSVASGFEQTALTSLFASTLTDAAPLPKDCES